MYEANPLRSASEINPHDYDERLPLAKSDKGNKHAMNLAPELIANVIHAGNPIRSAKKKLIVLSV